uniref:Mucin-5B n=1 Tax=Phascolarctos cinereus TaxID=38626 RepID=A0A6P5IWK2_PHACI|nr:mucin-5B [Phascolarctos cinereus]
MGTGRGLLDLLQTLVIVVCITHQAETQEAGAIYGDLPEYSQPDYDYFKTLPEPRPTSRMTFISTGTITPYASALNPSHSGQVCSTWGSFHYKTFDGDIFQFPGLCNYVFASHCQAAYEDFNIQIRHSLVGETPTISRILIKTEGVVLELSPGSVLINGQREQLPYSRSGFTVEASSTYVQVSVRMVLTFMWNGNDSALLELDTKYANQTCGLCGDFNGLSTFNEFYSNNVWLTSWQFGNLQKLDGPTEQCWDPMSSPASNCKDEESSCLRVLTGLAFSSCNQLVDPKPYIEACVQDLCGCKEANRSSCMCATFSEYSRQCAHAGGQPLNWRSQDLCYKACPSNMQYHECGSPCADTCSNPERSQLCEEHCTDGCFCPPGTVLDDVQGWSCVTQDQCHCTHNGQTYKPGASFSTRCSSCTCLSGLWQCEELPCPGTCSVEGGSHITTFDQKHYNIHGDCSYVLSKKCEDTTFAILGELRRCGMTDNENCLQSVTLNLNGGETVIRIQPNGGVLVNSIYTQLPISAANIAIFQPSTYFILVHATFGLLLQIQLVPFMQLSLRLDPSFRSQMCGLCGNFNQNQADDFTALSGVVEGTGAAFANTWKTQADCTNIKNSFENPCSLSVENENYAQHWCSLLTDPGATFSQCHVFVNPEPYYKNCMFDTCNCEKSEDCLCAALSSYVQACAAQGVLLSGWRAGVCTKYMDSCPSSLNYSYVVESCQPTCRSLSETDATCSIRFSPVDGCVCPHGTHLNDAGQCVPATQCPCYYKGTIVALGETVQENGAVCSCTSGKLSCFGGMDSNPVCMAPMIYLDCSNASAGALGAQCQKSCDTLDMACYNTQCVSGCICPSSLVKDGNICVKEEDCPCVHNEATYKSGEAIQVDCNKCTCKNRRWECTQAPCLGTCAVYGDGHFITFDSERYSFEGNCEYTLAQDYCGGNTTINGTFRVITENIPCGTTGVTCSKAIKVFLKGTELIFNEGIVKMVKRGPGKEVPYKIHSRGNYMVLETQVGMVLMWDRKTSIFIKLHQHYKGKVCGLCGNYDGNSMNDFTTRSLSVVGDVQEFGTSWKMSPSCPDAGPTRDPCTANPYRKAWAQKQCSIINSAIFATCRSQVDSTKYYEACVSDACACDSGGDCECFCTAVAAYAQACNDVGVCVSWRRPDICPMFCDFYNPHGECDWHYQPCGAPCLKTCRNPSGKCLVNLPGLEGCYPNCPAKKPFFSESQMKCVEQCGCYDEDGHYYEVGDKVVSQANCQSCNCTISGIQCTPDQNECTCTYEGHKYHRHEVIYNTTDGLGACLIAICGDNGEIKRISKECPMMPSTMAPFTFTTSRTPESTAGPATTISATSTVCVREACEWSDWYDISTPSAGLDSGDFETFEDLRLNGYQLCSTARDVECRAQAFPGISLGEVGQKVECSLSHGLLCYNAEQNPPLCHNYEIRVLCCSYVPCGRSTAVKTSTPITRSITTAKASTMLPQTLSTLTSQMSSIPTRISTPNVTCQPRCQWTQWFDTDYPKSEKIGGDIETYDKIRKTEKDFCQEPQGIECEAENYPDMTIEEVGQVVQCDVRFGLICRNEEQKGLFKMCNNYKIRVLCCDDSHCHGRTSVIPPATMLPFTTSLGTGTTGQTSLTSTRLVTESSRAATATQESTPSTLLSTHSSPRTTAKVTTTSLSTSPSVPHPHTAAILSTARTSAVSISTPLPTETKTVEVTRAATASPRQTTVKTSSPPIHSSTEAIQTTQRPPQTPKTPSLLTTRLVTESSPAATATQESTPSTLLSTHSSPRTTAKVTTTSLSTSPSVPHPHTAAILSTARTSAVSISTPLPTETKTVEVTRAATASPRQTTVKTSSPPIHSSTEAIQTTQRPPQTPKTPSLLTTRLVTESSPAATATQESTPSTLLSTHSSPRTTAKVTTTSLSTSPSVPHPHTAAILSTARTSAVSISTPLPTATKTVEVTRAATASPRQTTVKTIPHPHTAAILSTARTSAVSISTPLPTATKTVEVTRAATASPRQTTVKTSSPPIHSSTEAIQTTQRPQTPKTPSLLTTRLVTESSRAATATQESTPSTLLSTHSSPRTTAKVTTTSLSTSPSVPHPHTAAILSTARTSAVSISTPLPTETKTVEVTRAATASPRQTTVKTSSPPIHSSTEATQKTKSQSPNPAISAATTQLITPLGSQTTTLGPPGPTSTISTISHVTTLVSTPCQPKCEWTEWFDMDFPVSGISGGDIETYDNIRKAGGTICQQPQKLECRAENYPEVSIDQIGQILQCSLKFGLICRNEDQKGTFNMCFNYNIRVLCCDDYTHCPSTVAGMTSQTGSPFQSTSKATKPTQTASTPQSTIPDFIMSTSTLATATKEAISTPQSVSVTVKNITHTSSGSLGITWKFTSSKPLTAPQTLLATSGQSTTVGTFPLESTTARPNTLQTSGATKVTKVPKTAPRSLSTSSSFGTTSTSQTTAFSPITSGTTTATSATECQPRCVWTDWFDQSYPIPGKDGGDFETYDNIQAAGETICEKPREIQCRAENYMDTPIDQVGQVVECNVDIGLVCRNQDQAGRFKVCFNYHIRVLCCDYTHCSTTTRPTSTPYTGALSTVETHPGSTPMLSTLITTSSITPTGSRTPNTQCAPQCHWTEWFDTDKPRAGRYGGDIETYYSIMDAGGKICLEPRAIECQSSLYPDLPLDQLKQVLWCHVDSLWDSSISNSTASTAFWTASSTSVTTMSASSRSLSTSPQTSGLKMRGTKATQGKTEKVTSSVPLTSLQSTPAITSPAGPSAPATTATSSLESTTARPNTLPTSGATKVTKVPKTAPRSLSTSSSFGTTSTSQTTAFSPITSGTTTATSATECQPRCVWTDWFDQSYPIPGKDGGDFETYDNIQAAGETICEKPREIQCRAENYMDTPIDQVGQVVECNVDIGLVCRNQDQAGRFKVCFNYHIRVLCCDYTHCSTTTRPTSTPYTGALSTVETHPGSTPMLSTLITTSSITPTGSRTPNTQCAPQCHWTEWFDTDKPRAGRYGGDIETYYSIMDAGGKICLEPRAIECQSSLYPDLPLDQLKQVLWCHVDFGLICRNSHQKAPETMCLNYQIRVLCCDDYSPCGTAPSPTSTASMESAFWTASSTSVTTMSASSRSLSTSPQTSGLKTRGTKATQGKTEKVTSSVPLTSLQSTLAITSPAGPSAPATTATSSLESTTARPNTLPTSGATKVTKVPKTAPRSLSTSSSFGTTSTSQTTAFSPITSGTTTATSATECQPRCVWTDWFDQSYPIPGKDGGDFETYDNIQAAGETICEKPREVQCRAENYMDVPIDQVGQVVECNVDIGLVCRNQDQAGPIKYCLNYHIRVLCCDDYSPCVAPTSSSSASVPSHSRTPPVSSPTLQTSTIFTFSTSVSIPPVSQTSPVPSTLTTPCFCFVAGDLFSPGDVIYNKTDKAGCSFFAICNQQCEIKRFHGPCPTPTSSVPSSTVPQTTPPPGCYDVFPPRQPGEQWTSNCQDCICDNSSLTAQCRPVQCLEPTAPPKCQKEGFVIVYKPQAEDSCCKEPHCVCNKSSCPQDRPSCKPQEEPFSILPTDSCCPVFGCKERMCEQNGTTYGIGSTVPSDQPCHTCTCRVEVNPETNSTVWCEAKHCSISCAPDQEYKVLPGQCCGQCVPTTCLTPDGKRIKFNETWVNTTADNCTEYHCDKVTGQTILSQRPTECPDMPSCKGVLRRAGCCYECQEVEEDCQVQSNETLLQYEGCVSETAVNVTFCAGSCNSMSMYSLGANEIQRKCTCCQETQVHQEEVKMKCPDGREVQRVYTQVDACSCVSACLSSRSDVIPH